MVPLIVCATFSVELYLKSLIWHETGAPARGHNLETLFSLLSQTRKARIQHYYEQVVSRDRSSIEANPAPGHGPGSADFCNAMKVASDGFVDWRYVYERNMAEGPNLANYIAFAVRQAIIEICPTWKPA
jgi:hypothetical protein